MAKLYKSLGDALKFHRERMGLSRLDVAKLLNVTPSLVAKWEGNLRSCKNRLPELCKYYHITQEELLMSCKYSKKEFRSKEEKLNLLDKRCTILCWLSLALMIFVLSSLVTLHFLLREVNLNDEFISSPIKYFIVNNIFRVIKWHLQYLVVLSVVLFVVNILIESIIIYKKQKLTEENLERLKE